MHIFICIDNTVIELKKGVVCILHRVRVIDELI